MALIFKLKLGGDPGPDRLPAELFKKYTDWWAPLLTNLFTLTDHYGFLPDSWLNSTIMLVYKKGDPNLPENYCIIRLLSVLGKLCAKHLDCCLLDWTQSNSIIGPEQIIFSQNKLTLDLSYFIYSSILKELAPILPHVALSSLGKVKSWCIPYKEKEVQFSMRDWRTWSGR